MVGPTGFGVATLGGSSAPGGAGAGAASNRGSGAGVTLLNPRKRNPSMFKFLGGTVGIIFLIGLIVVIAFFKLLF
jgi:hypothetical protein